MSKPAFAILLVVVAVVALYAGYLYGNKRGYDRGLTDAAKAQAAAQTKIKVDSGYKNPFEGVNLNPFK